MISFETAAAQQTDSAHSKSTRCELLRRTRVYVVHGTVFMQLARRGHISGNAYFTGKGGERLATDLSRVLHSQNR